MRRRNSGFELNLESLQERIGFSRRLIDANVPAVVMADDGLRSTAFELVRTGAFGYCRRPPSIRDLKTMLSRPMRLRC